jgi:pyruvate kinase
MKPLTHRTKIVATIGPASSSIETLREMVNAGMNVARLNFSHGSYEDHARIVQLLRSVEAELDSPITLLQDLQGPKIRVGQLPEEGLTLKEGDSLTLVPLARWTDFPDAVGLDYPYLAEEASLGERILLDDGLMELRVVALQNPAVVK